jgi:hypothetical protein
LDSLNRLPGSGWISREGFCWAGADVLTCGAWISLASEARTDIRKCHNHPKTIRRSAGQKKGAGKLKKPCGSFSPINSFRLPRLLFGFLEYW